MSKLFPEPPENEVTPERLYLRRRELIKNVALAAGTATVVGGGLLLLTGRGHLPSAPTAPKAPPAPTARKAEDELTPWEDVTTYNNFYEFGWGKDDPARNAHTLRTRPWTVSIEGEVAKPGVLGIEDILKLFPAEERIYRLRCVEAWSMVIPWRGFPLAELLKRFEPTSKAKYVAFETLHDPEQMPGQRREVLDWPYTEALRIDEAMHPLTLMVTGLYGRDLPNQNGAPLRLVIPWKYGFKGAKSIVRIRLTEAQPQTSWNLVLPDEYGFYANVNPDVDHPRWSQSSERRIGEFGRRKTLPFNGYAEQVAHLYRGMDLAKYY